MILSASAVVALAQAPDAATLLAAARQALGGDAALSAVATFSAGGTHTREIGPMRATSTLDIRCALPDRFVRVMIRTVQRGPRESGQITDYEGFNRGDPIHDTVAPGFTFPVVIPAGPKPTTPAAIAADRTRLTLLRKHTFVELALPLFAASFGAYPLDFTASGRVQLADGPADAIDVKGEDDFTWRLFLDASTHLPVRLTWMASPVAVFSSSSLVAVGPRGQVVRQGGAAPLPPGDPTAAMPLVEWRMAIGDYRPADGLNWPHRFTTTVEGRTYEDMRLDRFKINPRIDDRKFAPRYR